MSGSDPLEPTIDGLARRLLGISPSIRVRWWDVKQVETGRRYVLLVYGEVGSAIGVGAIDAETNQALSTAALPGVREHVLVDRAEAASLLGAKDDEVELVWWSSTATRSPLYPVWQVVTRPQAGLVDILGAWHPEPVAPSTGA